MSVLRGRGLAADSTPAVFVSRNTHRQASRQSVPELVPLSARPLTEAGVGPSHTWAISRVKSGSQRTFTCNSEIVPENATGLLTT